MYLNVLAVFFILMYILEEYVGALVVAPVLLVLVALLLYLVPKTRSILGYYWSIAFLLLPCLMFSKVVQHYSLTPFSKLTEAADWILRTSRQILFIISVVKIVYVVACITTMEVLVEGEFKSKVVNTFKLDSVYKYRYRQCGGRQSHHIMMSRGGLYVFRFT